MGLTADTWAAWQQNQRNEQHLQTVFYERTLPSKPPGQWDFVWSALSERRTESALLSMENSSMTNKDISMTTWTEKYTSIS